MCVCACALIRGPVPLPCPVGWKGPCSSLPFSQESLQDLLSAHLRMRTSVALSVSVEPSTRTQGIPCSFLDLFLSLSGLFILFPPLAMSSLLNLSGTPFLDKYCPPCSVEESHGVRGSPSHSWLPDLARSLSLPAVQYLEIVVSCMLV